MKDKIKNLMEFKAMKEGEATPKAILEDTIKMVEEEDIKKIIIIAVNGEDYIGTAHSTMTHLELVGLFEVGKTIAIEEMNE